ncbi:MAG: TSUP family transporter [Paracoccaceae bacterium]
MSGAFQAALETDGLIWLFAGATLAGLVRGFSGFGNAMVYMPVAGAVLSPVWALTTMIVFDMIGPLPNARGALRDGHGRDVLRLGTGAVIALPAGVWALTRLEPDLFRWLVSLVALGLLALLATGWRYHGTLSRQMIYSIGALGGFLAGSTGLAGPPVIMLYMASRHGPAAIRANTLLFLLLADVLMLAVFGLNGLLEATPIVIGLMLALPYTLANMAGAVIFDPARERVYRIVAYVLVAASAVMGLPLLD